MPAMPKEALKLPYWADPDTESVTDPLWQTLVKKAVHLMGYDDPNMNAINSMMPMATPAVTIYKNAADRIAATQAFVDSAKKLGTNLSGAAEHMAQLYPRVAAHMRINGNPFEKAGAPSGMRNLASTEVPRGVVESPMTINFSPLALQRANASPEAGMESLAHEMTHGAQALGNSHLAEMYKLAERLLKAGGNSDAGAYSAVPYEFSARRRGTAMATGQPIHKATILIPAQDIPRRFLGQVEGPAQEIGGGVIPGIRVPFTSNRAMNIIANRAQQLAPDNPDTKRLLEIMIERGIRNPSIR